jgi:hypothetical protein
MRRGPQPIELSFGDHCFFELVWVIWWWFVEENLKSVRKGVKREKWAEWKRVSLRVGNFRKKKSWVGEKKKRTKKIKI